MIKNVKIFFSEDSEIVELEVAQKEWRGDVLVEVSGGLYQFEFITMQRIISEYRYALLDKRTYIIDDTTIIVEKLDKETIIQSLLKLDENIFKKLKPVNLKEKFKNVFLDLQDINKWVRVF